jgi:transcription antitermination factor NusB
MDSQMEDENEKDDAASSQRLLKHLMAAKAKSEGEETPMNQMQIERFVDDDYALDFSLLKTEDKQFARDLCREVLEQRESIDQQIDLVASRGIEEMGPIERAILRLATCELMYHPQTPYVVVINEAVDVARAYGPERSHTLVNATLDKLSMTHRAIERGV